MRRAVTFLGLLLAGACSDGVCPSVRAPRLADERSVLLQPGAPQFTDTAPDSFRVRFETTQGDIELAVYREWSPAGVDRLYNLVRAGYFEDIAFYRVLPGFVAQFGMHPVPAVNEAWLDSPLPDEPVLQRNERGTLTYAKAGPNTRTTQFFINYRDNSEVLDAQGFTPIGRVVEGMDRLLLIYGDYGDFPPLGNAPDMTCMMRGGNAYLERSYERLDYIRSATLIS
jgi:peptidyl-prolyl cis-trans isomerase A (cyclophilin A)